MKDFLKSEGLLKIAVIIGFSAMLLIFISVSSNKESEPDNISETEQRLITMISALCNNDDIPLVMIKTEKDGLGVLGVGIVTKSADDPIIKEKILELTSKVLDVSPARICITT